MKQLRVFYAVMALVAFFACLAVLATMPGCATSSALKDCMSGLQNGEKLSIFQDGKRFECERVKYGKASDSCDDVDDDERVRDEPSPSQRLDMPVDRL